MIDELIDSTMARLIKNQFTNHHFIGIYIRANMVDNPRTLHCRAKGGLTSHIADDYFVGAQTLRCRNVLITKNERADALDARAP